MKKIFLALAAVAALAACSKTEAEYEQTGEIGFLPVTRNMTKSMMTGTTFQTSEEFNLWAYYKPVAATDVNSWLAAAGDAQEYLDEKTFAYDEGKDGGKWAGKYSQYFWPKNGSLVFVGYYPASLEAKVHYDFEEQTMTFSNIQQSKVETSGYSEDIMYFNMTPSYSGNAVHAEFKHALSWISLVLKKDAATSADAKITVEKVEFTQVKPVGNGIVAEANDIVWAATGTPATVDILDDKDATTKNDVVLALNTDNTPEPIQPLFIPQTMAGDLVITYTITSKDNSYFREVKTIALNSMKSGSETLTEWEPAKHYTYTITIGTTEILVDPQVTTWVGVDVPTTI